MSNKKLTERLNEELDALGVPVLMTERVQACAKLLMLRTRGFNSPYFLVPA